MCLVACRDYHSRGRFWPLTAVNFRKIRTQGKPAHTVIPVASHPERNVIRVQLKNNEVLKALTDESMLRLLAVMSCGLGKIQSKAFRRSAQPTRVAQPTIGSGHDSRCRSLALLAVCKRHGDVTGRVAGKEAHQHAVLLVRACGFDRFANITGSCHALSGNL